MCDMMGSGVEPGVAQESNGSEEVNTVMMLSGMAILLLPLYFAVPALILYFVVKLAVKNAMRELNEEKRL